MKRNPKITLKLVRSFGLGFAIYSPKWNGACASVQIGCFEVALWNRGDGWLGFANYWNG